MYEILEHNIKIEKERKKLLYFSSENWYDQMTKMQAACINFYPSFS